MKKLFILIVVLMTTSCISQQEIAYNHNISCFPNGRIISVNNYNKSYYYYWELNTKFYTTPKTKKHPRIYKRSTPPIKRQFNTTTRKKSRYEHPSRRSPQRSTSSQYRRK